jgi:hypothetical protein
MTWSKSTVKPRDPDHNPIHVLYLAAKTIVEGSRKAFAKAGKDFDASQVTMPIWMDGNPPMKITIESGPSTTAEYAIFKAQTADAKEQK